MSTGLATASKAARIPALRSCAEMPQPATVGVLVGAGKVGADVGTREGLLVGDALGTAEGCAVGESVGASVGPEVGAAVGPLVGLDVGLFVGLDVGLKVISPITIPTLGGAEGALEMLGAIDGAVDETALGADDGMTDTEGDEEGAGETEGVVLGGCVALGALVDVGAALEEVEGAELGPCEPVVLGAVDVSILK